MSKDSISICGIDVTSASVIISSLLVAFGIVQVVLYSGGVIPSIGLLCREGGCSFQEGNLEEILRIYIIIQGVFYMIFGAVFLSGIIKRNARLVSAFICFAWLNVIMTLIFVIVSHAKLSNYLALSYLYTSHTLLVFCQAFVAYTGIQFRRMITHEVESREESLRLSTLCLLP